VAGDEPTGKAIDPLSQRTRLGGVPRSVWTLGFVSLFMDVSSEMIHALLPLFLVGVLGASVTTLGLIEGMAEAAASISKVVSGVASDRLGRHKPLALTGYALAAATKPLFALASSAEWVFFARFLDRIGKGVRGAPRDALLAELAPPEVRGASYGLRQALDTVGAVVGPLLATLLMLATGDAFRVVLWIACAPAVVSVLLMLLAVREPETRAQPGAKPLRREGAASFPVAFWWVVASGGLFTLARFSEAFLILRAKSVGLSAALAPLMLVVMNLVYAGSSYPAGRLSDRVSRMRLLFFGFAVLALADLVLAAARGPSLVVLGVLLWGLHMGLTQGLLSALVADTAPASIRGSAFGVLNLVLGVAMFASSVLAGWLWEHWGPSASFFSGAVLVGLALLVWVLVGRRSKFQEWSGAGP